jgi:hypothetical protein
MHAYWLYNRLPTPNGCVVIQSILPLSTKAPLWVWVVWMTTQLKDWSMWLSVEQVLSVKFTGLNTSVQV